MTTRSRSDRRATARLTAGSAFPAAKQARKKGQFREIDPAKRRTRLVKVYLTDAEHERVSRNAADLASTSVSSFARQCVLGTQIESRADLRVAAQLQQHFGLVKKLLSELNDVKDVAARKAALGELVSLRKAITGSLAVINEAFAGGQVERNEGHA